MMKNYLAGTAPAWTEPGWSRRLRISVQGGVAAIAGYPVRVVMPFMAGMKVDFSDCRFRDDAGTSLPYMIQNMVASSFADFWVTIPSVPASPSVTKVWCYYGNAGATQTGPVGFTEPVAGVNPINPPTQAWEGTVNPQRVDTCIVKHNGGYIMFYDANEEASPSRIGLAYATAEQYPATWTKEATNPIYAAQQGNLDVKGVNSPVLVKMQDNSWRMYMCPADVNFHQQGSFATCTAENFPVGPWVPHGTIILARGGVGTWDEIGLIIQIVVPAWDSPDGQWHFIYGGVAADGETWYTGHATSPDGITLTKDPANPILVGSGVPGSWDEVYTFPGTGYFRLGDLWVFPLDGYGTHVAWQGGFVTTRDFVTFSRNCYNPNCVVSAPTAITPVTAPDGWAKGSRTTPAVFLDPDTGIVDLFFSGPFTYNIASPSGGGNSYKFGYARMPGVMDAARILRPMATSEPTVIAIGAL